MQLTFLPFLERPSQARGLFSRGLLNGSSLAFLKSRIVAAHQKPVSSICAIHARALSERHPSPITALRTIWRVRMRVMPEYRPISAKVPPLSHSRKIACRRNRCASLRPGFFSPRSGNAFAGRGRHRRKPFCFEVWDKATRPHTRQQDSTLSRD